MIHNIVAVSFLSCERDEAREFMSGPFEGLNEKIMYFEGYQFWGIGSCRLFVMKRIFQPVA